nr:hypothetical protein KPHV_19290 [Kitasatospora purpeofusca]
MSDEQASRRLTPRQGPASPSVSFASSFAVTLAVPSPRALRRALLRTRPATRTRAPLDPAPLPPRTGARPSDHPPVRRPDPTLE